MRMDVALTDTTRLQRCGTPYKLGLAIEEGMLLIFPSKSQRLIVSSSHHRLTSMSQCHVDVDARSNNLSSRGTLLVRSGPELLIHICDLLEVYSVQFEGGSEY